MCDRRTRRYGGRDQRAEAFGRDDGRAGRDPRTPVVADEHRVGFAAEALVESDDIGDRRPVLVSPLRVETGRRVPPQPRRDGPKPGIGQRR